MAALRRLIARLRLDSGAEFVEFALALPLLLFVVLGIMDFGMMFQQYEVITNAAREGSRVFILPGYVASDAQCRAAEFISNSAISGGCSTPNSYCGVSVCATITTSGPTSVAVGGNCISTKTVIVNYPHQYLFLSGIGAYFGGSFGTKTLSASATMRDETTAGTCS